MLRILFHLLLMLAMLAFERHAASRLKPWKAALLWYLLGVPLMWLEARASAIIWKPVFLQSLATALFFLPPAYLAFRAARARGKVWIPFFLFIALSCLAGIVAALAFAHAPAAFGSVWKA